MAVEPVGLDSVINSYGCSKDTLARRHELGQFLTPSPVADFMASLFSVNRRTIRLLDAGAGAGALTRAMVRKLCSGHSRPKEISVTAYEYDSGLLKALEATLFDCQRECKKAGLEFDAVIHNSDFIEAVVPIVRGELFAPTSPKFNVAIANPPYRKIRSDSPARLLLRSAGIETSNLYTGFLALIFRLLSEGAEMVAITPRSFCNGPYFRPFREDFLSQMSLRRLHVFDSRSAAFNGDDVLQENIIFHALKSPDKPEHVVISTSSGKPGAEVREHRVPFQDVVSPADPEIFIHLVADHGQAKAREFVRGLKSTLTELGIFVSTGRVVDFRAKSFLRSEPAPETVPLIYPCHFDGEIVRWPKEKSRKPNAIVHDGQTHELLVPSEVYVLVKRFTSKEERRRVVACIYDPHKVPGKFVGFENHLNYFHVDGHGMKMSLAKGLAAFLNSTAVDVYFRQFNGHTQVNATDLRNMHYPTEQQLIRLGHSVGSIANQSEIDNLLETQLNGTT